MINIILGGLILHMFNIIVFKPKLNTLGCGIMAWAGKDPKEFNKSKFDILGIFNEKRGEHSCGITVDGEIRIGVDKEKVYRDFLANVDYTPPQVYPTVIGHTRWATGGAHNVDNAHPFGYGNIDGEYEFIGVHNGSLLNHKDLAKEYQVETKIEVQRENYKTDRTKIDSEILLECIFNSNNFDVLEKYEGAAAIVATNIKESNVLYCYHGESKKFKTDRIDDVTEERPLYYYQESETSVYISSMKNSLEAIGGDETSIGEFRHNTVYKVVDGKVSLKDSIDINRYGMHQKGGYIYQSNSYNHNNYNYNKDPFNKNHSKSTQTSLPIGKNDASNIYFDNPLLPLKDYKDSLYFNKLTYWRNGHVAEGVYKWMENIGFIQTFESEKEHPLYYFYKGVRIKTKQDYVSCLDMEKKGNKFNWEVISLCSAHPIIDTSFSSKGGRDQGIMYNGLLANDVVCPLGSEKIYTIKNGNCIKIENVLKDERKDTKTLDSIIKRIEDTEAEIREKETKVIDINKDNDLVEGDINEMFASPLRAFPSYISKLKEYKNTRATEAQGIMESFIKNATKLMLIDNK